MKILLDYDPESGNIATPDGAFIYSFAGLGKFEHEEGEILSTNGLPDVDSLIRLKDAGFTTEDIIALHSRELV